MSDENPQPEADPGDANQEAGKHEAAETSEAPVQRDWNTTTQGPKPEDRPGAEHETGI